MKTKGKWIVFEGLDKGGKTSLAERLVSEFPNTKYIKGICAPTRLGAVARHFPSTWLFAFEALVSTLIARSWKNQGYTVFQDRSIILVVCHIPLSYIFPNNIISSLSLCLFPKPDYLIYVSVKRRERIRRMKENGENNQHEKQLINHPIWIGIREKEYEKCYQNFSKRKLKLDTSHESIRVSLQKIKQFIK